MSAPNSGENNGGVIRLFGAIAVGIVIAVSAALFSGYQNLLTGQAALVVQVQDLQTDLKGLRVDLNQTRSELTSLRFDLAGSIRLRRDKEPPSVPQP